jgi:hypothetical protein
VHGRNSNSYLKSGKERITLTEWTKEKEKKVLWKYRFLLTARILRVLIIIGFLYGLYSILLSIGYSKTDFQQKHDFQMNLAIDWTEAGLYGEYSGHYGGEITPFLSQKLSIPVYRTIGKKQHLVATMKYTKRLIPLFSTKQMEYVQPSENKRFGFYLPEDPRTDEKLSLNDHEDVWTPLEKVHEGTVADLAFSTDKYYNPKDLLQIVEQFDLDVLWMPLYAGELKAVKDVPWSMAGGNYLSVNTLGLSKAREILDDYNSWTEISLDSEKVGQNQEIMLSNMKKLIENESKTYLEQSLGLWYLEDRYEYLKENGFEVYGAVVTGPVKELLKLKELDMIQGVQVGEFDYWNWESNAPN